MKNSLEKIHDSFEPEKLITSEGKQYSCNLSKKILTSKFIEKLLTRGQEERKGTKVYCKLLKAIQKPSD